MLMLRSRAGSRRGRVIGGAAAAVEEVYLNRFLIAARGVGREPRGTGIICHAFLGGVGAGHRGSPVTHADGPGAGAVLAEIEFLDRVCV